MSGDEWVRSAFGDTGAGAACAGIIVGVANEARRARRPVEGDGLDVLERGDCGETRRGRCEQGAEISSSSSGAECDTKEGKPSPLGFLVMTASKDCAQTPPTSREGASLMTF